MKTVKKSVFVIGVALSVAPIFSSAYAQSAPSSAGVLSELQAMRTEIAELRDMIERQQFQFKKLEQSVAKAQVAKPSLAPQSSQPAYQEQYAYGQAEAEAQMAQGATEVGSQPGTDLVSPQSYPEITQNTYGQDVAGVYQQPEGYNAAQAPDAERQAAANAQSVLTSRAEIDNSVSNRQDVEVLEPSIYPSGGIQNAPALGIDPMVQRSTSGIDSISSDAAPAGSVLAIEPTANRGAINTRVGSPILAVPRNASTQINNSGAINARQIPQAPITPVTPVASAEAAKAPTIDQQVASKPPVGKPATVQFTEDQYYDRGFDFLKQSKYDEAISIFNEQTAQYPQGELADDAHYWIAEALFINRKPLKAKPHLRTIIDNYPQSARLPDAMLKTAYIEQDLGNVIEARILLQEIVAKYGSSNAAIAARNRLESLKSGN